MQKASKEQASSDNYDIVISRPMIFIVIALCCLFCPDISQAMNDVVIKWDVASFKVKKGDTLSSLSLKTSASKNVLRALNHLKTDHIRAGSTFQYPKLTITFSSPIKEEKAGNAAASHNTLLAYRVYLSNNVFYLMAVVDDTEEYRNVLIYIKNGNTLRELDSHNFPFTGTHNLRAKLIVKDIEKNGNEECFYFAEYIGSSKDEGIGALCHTPSINENSLHGIMMNIHWFSIGAQEDEGYPPFSETTEEIGDESISKYGKYHTYLIDAAEQILGKHK